MRATVADILAVINALAPGDLAEQWDNCGLQIGRRDWPVERIHVALDPLPEVISEACTSKADLLVTHHPLIFKPLKRVELDTPIGAAVQACITNRLAVIGAHTNLDSARGGTNDELARRIGLQHLRALKPPERSSRVKLAVYVPVGHEDRCLEALFQTRAGRIGGYSCCSFRSRGRGTFCPGSQSEPFIGQTGAVSHVDELKIEAVVDRRDLDRTVEQLRQAHPYETMAYDVYPVARHEETGEGLGRIGVLPRTLRLDELAQQVKQIDGAGAVKIAGDPALQVITVAVCTGSGGGLLPVFLGSTAQVYISGDLHYHDARTIEAFGRGLIDIGHFASEHLIVAPLAEKLAQKLMEQGMDVHVGVSSVERDPFQMA